MYRKILSYIYGKVIKLGSPKETIESFPVLTIKPQRYSFNDDEVVQNLEKFFPFFQNLDQSNQNQFVMQMKFMINNIPMVDDLHKELSLEKKFWFAGHILQLVFRLDQSYLRKLKAVIYHEDKLALDPNGEVPAFLSSVERENTIDLIVESLETIFSKENRKFYIGLEELIQSELAKKGVSQAQEELNISSSEDLKTEQLKSYLNIISGSFGEFKTDFLNDDFFNNMENVLSEKKNRSFEKKLTDIFKLCLENIGGIVWALKNNNFNLPDNIDKTLDSILSKMQTNLYFLENSPCSVMQFSRSIVGVVSHIDKQLAIMHETAHFIDFIAGNGFGDISALLKDKKVAKDWGNHFKEAYEHAKNNELSFYYPSLNYYPRNEAEFFADLVTNYRITPSKFEEQLPKLAPIFHELLGRPKKDFILDSNKVAKELLSFTPPWNQYLFEKTQLEDTLK